MSRITRAAAERLAARLTGPLFLPRDEGFASEVAAFNSSVVHQPDLIIGAETAADVQAGVRFAAARGLPVAVQATGHGARMPFKNGLMISTKRMDSYEIDPDARLASFEAGVQWGPIAVAAAEHGLAPLTGASPTVGAVGYTLAGGIPLMGRTFGYAAGTIRSAELVTPDGELRKVSQSEYPELFWGLHGAQGALGIVVRLTVQLLPVDKIYGGGIYFDEEYVSDVFQAYPEWAATLPEEMSTSLALLRFPEGSWGTGQIRGRTVAHLRVCFVGGAEEGDQLLAAIRAVAPSTLDQVFEMSYPEAESIYADSSDPVPYYQRVVLLNEPLREAVRTLLEFAKSEEGALVSSISLRQMGGAFSRCTGFPISGQNAEWSVSHFGVLSPGSEDEVQRSVESLVQKLGRWASGGTLLNIHGAPRDVADRIRAWPPDVYERLAKLVRKTDPNGMFASEFITGGLRLMAVEAELRPSEK